MSDKPQVSEVDDVPAPVKRSCGARFVAHYKKWWWVHLIVFVAVFLIIALPVVYVGYPHIAQSDVNKSTLNVTSMVVTNPTPESFHIDQVQVIGSHVAYHPQLYAFNASISLAGAASFASALIPAVKAINGATVTVNQELDVTSLSAFTDFTTAFLLNEEVGLNIYGKPHLKLGGLPEITVTYNKTATMKGLNKFKGFTLTDYSLVAPANSNGTNFKGTAIIPNASPATFSFGNVTLQLAANGTHIGESYLQDLVVKPGNNSVFMTSTVNETIVVDLMFGTDAPYPDGIVPIVITADAANASVYDGKVLSYYSHALAENTMNIKLNLSSLF
ncbi:hypothetical protein ASPZODRAFT_131533 [Penicilliopsis zonata CBS 506.65]|uniref:Uncharacterized protein n=1 Tax=Penicilliopsis zonata CBS 506.65 TaxID=1073090 RepID=A0A1L9SLC3_9EURO|nr:hypothetical protein ASPZODRAFT_131533 [Penicilliopsis zonata CBS 506.65]OJJ47923.1 hypothetical protein ASPZODRAFT_131533 [Penicilliopsis zonata CBS 506.65]